MNKLFILAVVMGYILSLYAGGIPKEVRLHRLKELEGLAKSLVPAEKRGDYDEYLRKNPDILRKQIEAERAWLARVRKDLQTGTETTPQSRIYSQSMIPVLQESIAELEELRNMLGVKQ
jgi:hypothetical protein